MQKGEANLDHQELTFNDENVRICLFLKLKVFVRDA